MFGYVTANLGELTKQQQSRYRAVYCGICRQIRERSGQLAGLSLSYDMAFLALLLMSLYEPEEASGKNGCIIHPITRREWVNSPAVRYAADMNVALAYYNCLDDWQDEGKHPAKWMADRLQQPLLEVEKRFPRQCAVIRECIEELSVLEKENCPNPDGPASVFGRLMGELLVMEEDFWSPTLRKTGNALGRFIYLLDAQLDYDRDKSKGKYNPFLAKKEEKDWTLWEEYLVLTMSRCTAEYEKLPLVQDKSLLDNILYSGVWINYRRKRKEEERRDGRSV